MTQTAQVVLAEGFDKSVADIAQQQIDAFSNGIESFDKLRNRTPRFEGERVYLKSWNENIGKGGGFFVGKLTKQADDGGYIASVGTGYHWKRECVDIDHLTVLDFGAVGDGTTDDAPAVRRMIDFSYSNYAKTISIHAGRVGVRFPTGSFNVSPIDITDKGEVPEFVIFAPWMIFGVMPLTTITSDKSDKPVFLVKARRMTIHGINWDGQQTTPINRKNESNPTGTNMLVGATMGIFNDTASNKQSFLRNICAGGEYVRIHCFRAYRTGGVVFDTLDTLDTKLDQVYGNMTAAPFITAGWSNQSWASWDHSTALELSNANFQFCMAPAIYAPRCAQSIFDNVWFEHGAIPFDINNGHFRLMNVSVEDCVYNPVAWKARLNIQGWSGPTGNRLDTTTLPTDPAWPSYPTNPDGQPITGWLSGYEDGKFELEHYGARFDCPVRILWSEGNVRGRNNTGSSVWVKLCRLQSQTVGQQWELEILSKNGYSGLRAAPKPTGDGTAGKTVIRVQRGAGSAPILSMHHEGFNGILEAQYSAPYSNIVEIWVKVAAWCGEYSMFAKSTGLTRYDTGTCSIFTPYGEQQSEAPGLTPIAPMFSLHNGQAGVGAYGDTIAFDTAFVSASQIDTSKTPVYVKVRFNGKDYALALNSLLTS